MSEQEFLNGLRESLIGSLPENEINENIRYYRDYINQGRATKSEEEVIAGLGDPRLIARTIIETYQRTHGKETYSQRVEYEEEEENNGRFRPHRSRTFQLSGKAAGIIALIILLLVFGVVLAVGGMILSLFIRFFFPILGVILIISVLRNLLRK